MALLDDIETQLVADGVGGGATGWSIHKSFQPDTPDKSIAIYETGGFSPIKRFGAGNTTSQPTFQIIVRSSAWDYENARIKAIAAINSLDYVTIGNKTIFVSGSLIPLGHDEQSRPSISVNFEIKNVGGHE